MSEPASISAGIARRYAQAVFDLSRDAGELEKLAADVADFHAAMRVSDDLRDVLASPVLGRVEQGHAIGAVAAKMGLGDTLANTLRLMAAKRRLFVVPQMIAVLGDMLAEEKGEVAAEVRSAKALSEAQAERLARTLKASTGKDVNLQVTVDPSLIGGLVVKIGSRMIDTSIRARLNALQNTMKEAR